MENPNSLHGTWTRDKKPFCSRLYGSTSVQKVKLRFDRWTTVIYNVTNMEIGMYNLLIRMSVLMEEEIQLRWFGDVPLTWGVQDYPRLQMVVELGICSDQCFRC